MNREFMITEGSKYRVCHGDDDQVTEGVFKGLSVIGNDSAMVFEIEGGVLRFINTTMIVYMDLLESAPEDGTKKKSDAGNVYYG